MRVRTTVAALTLGAAAIAGVSPAGAVDDAKPGTACYGQAFTDKKGDQASKAPAPGDGARENLDLIGGFYKYDAAKGDDAATFNIQIANLSTEIPQGATAVSWYVSYGNAAGDPWLRALTDFTGVVSYETGHYEIVGPQTQSVRDGGTNGAFFEGPDGVIQIVYPKDGPGKPGTALKVANITAYEARQVLPGASPTPAKGGLLYEVDVAATKGGWTVGAACPATQPAAPAPSTTAPSPTPQQLNSGSQPLPVKLLTTKAKRAKVLKLKLKASETVTKFGLQIRQNRKVFGKATAASLKGTKTLKVKAPKLKKGTYTVDLAGTDASGARRFAVAKLKVS
jgi:hypothetical protein